MNKYYVLKRIPTGDTKVPLAEAIADLGFVHIESVAAMLAERERQKDKEAQHYHIILASHPGAHIPCSKCACTEFRKDANGRLYCGKCDTPTSTHPEPYYKIVPVESPKPFCLNCGRTEFWKDPSTGCLHCRKCFAVVPTGEQEPPEELICKCCGHDTVLWCEDHQAMCSRCGTVTLIPKRLWDRPSLTKQLDQARAERDQAQRFSDDYAQRWHSVQKQRDAVIQKCNRFGEEMNDLRRKARAHKEQISKLKKERDELLDMLDDMEPRVSKAEAATHQARVERDEAKAEAMTALEAVEKMTAEREKPPKIETTLCEYHFVILRSNPDRPYSRVPCAKCGHHCQPRWDSLHRYDQTAGPPE